jgi:hypothetical protein
VRVAELGFQEDEKDDVGVLYLNRIGEAEGE